jgi:hypothetical protein
MLKTLPTHKYRKKQRNIKLFTIDVCRQIYLQKFISILENYFFMKNTQ